MITKDLTTRRAVVAPLSAHDTRVFLGFAMLLLTTLVDPLLITSLLLSGSVRVFMRRRLSPSTKRLLTWVVLIACVPSVFILGASVHETNTGHALPVLWLHPWHWIAAPVCLWLIVQHFVERRSTTTAPRFSGHDFEAWVDEPTRTFNLAAATGVISGPLGHWVIAMTRGETTIYSQRDVPLQRLDYFDAMGFRVKSHTTGGYTATKRTRHMDNYITYTLRLVEPSLYAGNVDPAVATIAMSMDEATVRAQDDADHLFTAWLDAHRKEICLDQKALHAQWKTATDAALTAVRAQAGKHKGAVESYAWDVSYPNKLATYHLIDPKGRVFAWVRGVGSWVSADQVQLPPEELADLKPQQAAAVHAALRQAQHACGRVRV